MNDAVWNRRFVIDRVPQRISLASKRAAHSRYIILRNQFPPYRKLSNFHSSVPIAHPYKALGERQLKSLEPLIGTTRVYRSLVVMIIIVTSHPLIDNLLHGMQG
jgi:hypothetical protein